MNPQEYDQEIQWALAEDLGARGDVTTAATIPTNLVAVVHIEARQAGVLAGLPLAEHVFRTVEPRVEFTPLFADGSSVKPMDRLAEIKGPAAGILTAERTALNFLGHLSGIATAANRLVKAVEGTGATILDTRKTTPGLRRLEKYAARMGGALNHRMGLFDAILIKDNHIRASGGIRAAVERARAANPELPIEVEVESLDQLEEAIASGADTVLLDNMEPAQLGDAVVLAQRRVKLEASGGVTPERVRIIAETGVDYISSGWITHSAPNLDVALEFSL